jgi:hypothetical protein
MPVRVKKTRQNKRLEPGSDSIRTDKALRAFSREGHGSRKETASKRKNEAATARLFRHRQMIYQTVRISGYFKSPCGKMSKLL